MRPYFQGPYLVHLKAIGVNMLTEEEQATSRENCQVWKERKEKVKLFEGKQTAAAKKRVGSGGGDNIKVQKSKEVSFRDHAKKSLLKNGISYPSP